MKLFWVPVFALVLVGFSSASANVCTSQSLKLVTPSGGSNLEIDGVVSPVTGHILAIHHTDLGASALIEESVRLGDPRRILISALDFSVSVGTLVEVGQVIGRQVSIKPNLIARSLHPDLGLITVSNLEGPKTESMMSRVLQTYQRRFDLVRESDREFGSFSFESTARSPKDSALREYEFNKRILVKFEKCVQAIGMERRQFSGAQFAVVIMDGQRYLVERTWSE